MANAKVTQSAAELITLQNASAKTTQSVIELIVGGPLPSISCGGPPSGKAGTFYTHTFPAMDGNPPYTFALVGGALPPGLSLDPSTGTVSGIPTGSGVYSFTISVTDSTPRTASVTCSITIPFTFVLAGAIGSCFRQCGSGVEYQATLLLEALRRDRERKAEWPYVQLLPKPETVNVEEFGVEASPVAGSVTVLTYRVPSGFRFYLDAILQVFIGGAFQPGDAIWTVAENADMNAPSVQSSRVQGLQSVPVPLGSLIDGRYWPFEQPYEFAPLTVLRSEVVNVNLGAGSPNFFVSGFFGFLVPLDRGRK